jgi:hypothetical protein
MTTDPSDGPFDEDDVDDVVEVQGSSMNKGCSSDAPAASVTVGRWFCGTGRRGE